MKELWSIFGDLNECYITGLTTDTERHHCFEGRQGFKQKSEELGYIVCLHRSLHGHGAFANSSTNWRDLDHFLKRKCQEHFLENTGTREEWYDIFGKFYDDRTDEKIWRNTDD